MVRLGSATVPINEKLLARVTRSVESIPVSLLIPVKIGLPGNPESINNVMIWEVGETLPARSIATAATLCDPIDITGKSYFHVPTAVAMTDPMATPSRYTNTFAFASATPIADGLATAVIRSRGLPVSGEIPPVLGANGARVSIITRKSADA